MNRQLFTCLVFLFLSLLFIFAGAYLGLWIMLVGGIVSLIDQFKAPDTDSMTIAVSLVKIVFFEIPFIGGFWLGFVSFFFALGVLNKSKKED
ncbi:MAG: hypothetical protein RLZZ44_488 [Bacteroidota bacterium]